jgi:hypothetical protein
MSFDIFLQGFAGGEATPGRPDAAVRVLAPYFTEAPDDGFVCVQLADGQADVYGVGRSSLMVNHAAGGQIWGLIVTVATAAGWVIMPVGCPVCVVADEQAADLPDELRTDVVVVRSGTELLQVIRSD